MSEKSTSDSWAPVGSRPQEIDPKRSKPNSFYLLIFTGTMIFGFVIVAIVQFLTGFRVPASGILIPLFSAIVTNSQFTKTEKRGMEKRERRTLVNQSFLVTIVIAIVTMAIAYFSGVFDVLGQSLQNLSRPLLIAIFGVIAIFSLIIQYLVLRLGFGRMFAGNPQEKPVVDEDNPEGQEVTLEGEEKRATATATPEQSQTDANSWQPVSDGGAATYAPGEERAPWVRWTLSAVLLAVIAFAALWLISKTIISDDLPVDRPRIELPTGQSTSEEEPAPPKSADEQAWVTALEKDTLEGYREYLEAFPNGRYKDKAQEEINAYDNKAWETAERRNTIVGYEDYLEGWPEGLHAPKAKERIAEMKARIEAANKDAAERAAAESRDWDAAALANTIPAYQAYLGKHPSGAHSAEAQNRIDRLNAAAAQAQADATETAAWNTAKASNTVRAYERYLTSYPQGRYAADAMAAIENLRPSPGKTFRDCDICPTMVSLPSGNADLGAAENEKDARPNEKPRRPVTIGNMFAMSVTEVTFSQWEACVSGGGCASRPNDNGWGGGNRPVINVSWDDAQKYTTWLSSKTGLSYSLPSETQWEYAARSGETGTLAGGSAAALCAFANGAGQESGLTWANSACTDPASDRTLPVGMLGANKFGLKDMIGNVGEWTMDCNTINLKDAPVDGSADLRGSCNQRVVRGGSWFSGPADLRYAARLMQRRGDSNDFTGFRIVRKVQN